MILRNKKIYISFGLIAFFACCAVSQTSNKQEIIVGMQIKSVCDNFSIKISDRFKDPCHGYVQYNEEKKAIMLWNRNKTIFLVFNNVPSSAFNRRGRLNFKRIGDKSKLLLITSSGEEGLFFIKNMIN